MRLAPRCGEHDDRRPPVSAGAQPAQHLDAVEPGHRDVEEHELRLALFDLPEGLGAALGGPDAVALLEEDRLVQGKGVGEVVDDEDVARDVAQGGHRGTLDHESTPAPLTGGGLPGGEDSASARAAVRGSTSVKIEPSPWRERTSMSPPSARARRRERARPTPVPS